MKLFKRLLPVRRKSHVYRIIVKPLVLYGIQKKKNFLKNHYDGTGSVLPMKTNGSRKKSKFPRPSPPRSPRKTARAYVRRAAVRIAQGPPRGLYRFANNSSLANRFQGQPVYARTTFYTLRLLVVVPSCTYSRRLSSAAPSPSHPVGRYRPLVLSNTRRRFDPYNKSTVVHVIRLSSAHPLVVNRFVKYYYNYYAFSPNSKCTAALGNCFAYANPWS